MPSWRPLESTGGLVLDLRMPGIGGLELLRHLDWRIPVIILPAHGDDEARACGPSRPAPSRSSRGRSKAPRSQTLYARRIFDMIGVSTFAPRGGVHLGGC